MTAFGNAMTILGSGRWAQTTGTTTPGEVEIVEPSRPISDWIVDVFGLDPDGTTAAVLSSLIEPVVQIVATIVIAWLALKILRRMGAAFIRRGKIKDTADMRDPGVAGRRNQRLDALSAVLGSILTVVVWFTAFLVILGSTFGVNLAPFLAGAGILGVALGFGAQDLVKDFLAGTFMLVEDQYAVGDVVDVGDAVGTVEKVSLRTTRLRDVNGTVWHFPNGEIRRVGNMSQEWSRALLDIAIGYDSDIDQASGIIKAVADEMAGEPAYQRQFLTPPEVWGVENVAADGVVIRLVIKTIPGQQWGIARELRRRIKLAMDDASIEIPVPQTGIRVMRHHDPGQPSEPMDLDTPSAARGKGAPDEGPAAEV